MSNPETDPGHLPFDAPPPYGNTPQTDPAPVLMLDNDTAIVPSRIVKVAMVLIEADLYCTTILGRTWVVRVTTIGGADFDIDRCNWSYNPEASQAEVHQASEWAKGKIALTFERVLAAL